MLSAPKRNAEPVGFLAMTLTRGFDTHQMFGADGLSFRCQTTIHDATAP